MVPEELLEESKKNSALDLSGRKTRINTIIDFNMVLGIVFKTSL